MTHNMIQAKRTCQAQTARRAGLARRRPSALVEEAYWYATRLQNHGWQIDSIIYRDGSGHFSGRDPQNRPVRVDCDSRHAVDSLPLEFAYSIRRLGGLSSDGHDYVLDLRIVLGSGGPAYRPVPTAMRYWHVPDEQIAEQPRDIVRAAYWLAATLTDDYGWQLTQIGSEQAAGGFIAILPEDPVRVFPAGINDDGTTAASLAHLIGELTLTETAQLAQLVSWHNTARSQER
ncbi:hypothetical protein [Mycobacteroides abscessus]|uniref:hypothetical protein n=1 Tax=Mycobacteroides abscessus TaxID=36809 RepID=UPI0010562166|nr:hypothetical protein [Mycobacteroides abscessus]